MKISKAIEVRKLIESIEETNKEIAELQDLERNLSKLGKKCGSFEYAESIINIMNRNRYLAGLINESIKHAIKLRTQSLETRKKTLEQDLDDM